MAVAARFFVQSYTRNATDYTSVVLTAATRGEGNRDWAKYTPSGKIEMNISNETPAAQWFVDHLSQEVSVVFDDISVG